MAASPRCELQAYFTLLLLRDRHDGRACPQPDAQPTVMASSGTHVTLPDFYGSSRIGMIIPKVRTRACASACVCVCVHACACVCMCVRACVSGVLAPSLSPVQPCVHYAVACVLHEMDGWMDGWMQRKLDGRSFAVRTHARRQARAHPQAHMCSPKEAHTAYVSHGLSYVPKVLLQCAKVHPSRLNRATLCHPWPVRAPRLVRCS